MSHSSNQSVQRQMMSFFVPMDPLSASQISGSQPEESSAEQTNDFSQHLLQAIQQIFHFPSFLTPEITTFEGDLVSDEEKYTELFKPGLHLIIYFPLTVASDPATPLDESQAWDDASAQFAEPFPSFPGEELESDVMTVDPSRIALTNHPHDHYQIRKTSNPRPIHFQPPSLSFQPASKIPIAVALGSSLMRNNSLCFIRGTHEFMPTYSAPSLTNSGVGTPSSVKSSPFIRAYTNPILAKDWPIAANLELPAIKTVKYPWPPVATLVHPRPEGTFPLATFDVFAQGKRRRIVSSVYWDAVAHPSGKISIADSKEKRDGIDWDLGDVADESIPATARRINWVNYAPSIGYNTEQEREEAEENNEDTDDYAQFNSPSALSRRKSGRFWMLHPPRQLPAAFLPPKHTSDTSNLFYFSDASTQVPLFMARLYSELDFPGEKVEAIASHWQRVLHGAREIGKRVIVKLLAPREVSRNFPIEVEPMPEELIRAFVVMWMLGSDEEFDIEVADNDWEDDEVKLRRVIQIIQSRGKSPSGVSVEDFRVFEWGGIILPYGCCASGFASDEDARSEASDRTIRPSQRDVEMEDAFGEKGKERERTESEDVDTPMANDVDAVVLGEDGMYFVMRS